MVVARRRRGCSGGGVLDLLMGRVGEFRGSRAWRSAQGGKVLQVPANDVIDGCATVSEDLELELLF